jgi:tetratricopeptide (TPR) repeat protein
VERQAEAYLPFDAALSLKAAQEAAALYRQTGDRRGESRMLRLEGRCHFYQNRHDLAEGRTHEAIDVLETDECAELGRAVAQLAGLVMARTAMDEAIPIAERAIELGERFADPWTLANALITRGSAERGERGLPYLRRGLDVAVKNRVHEASQRAYNNMSIALIVSAAPVGARRALILEGLEYGRRHGHEQATATFLLSHLATLQFGTGEWDAALESMAKMHEGPGVYRWVHIQRGWIGAARGGPDRALSDYARLAELVGDPALRVFDLATLAYGRAIAGRNDDARASLASLEELIARWPSGSAERDTPRSALGASLHQMLLVAALLLDEPRWVDIVAAEMRAGGLEQAQRHGLAAARFLVARDAQTCARELADVRQVFEPVGFEGMAVQYAIGCLRFASTRGLELGPEWRSFAVPMRAFAERAGARWWISVLQDAGL